MISEHTLVSSDVAVYAVEAEVEESLRRCVEVYQCVSAALNDAERTALHALNWAIAQQDEVMLTSMQQAVIQKVERLYAQHQAYQHYGHVLRLLGPAETERRLDALLGSSR